MSKFSDQLDLTTITEEVETHFSGGLGLLSKALVWKWIGEKILADGEARAESEWLR